MIRLSWSLFFLFVSLQTWAGPATPKAGVWRFELRYPNHVAVPFLMELEPGKKGWSATLINGPERIAIEDIRVEKGRWILPLQTYQNQLELEVRSKNSIVGHFVKTNKSPVERIPVRGEPGALRRFERSSPKPEMNLAGKWAMEITEDNGTKGQAIALFDQTGMTLTASILTPTGDYRYIDGVVFGKQFESAEFDGVFNFVFRGQLYGDTLTGEIASKTISRFTAKRDDKAVLPDPYKQTSADKIEFRFPDTAGKEFSLEDEAFKGKPVIVQIFGSWCPNCMDELNFLGPWYLENRAKGIEVVALSFERANTPEEARSHLSMVVRKRAIPYPVLLVTSTKEDTPDKKLPGLKNFLSFPTTIFLNKKHQVHKVHTGFSGPGTGLYYEEFKKSFQQTVAELMK